MEHIIEVAEVSHSFGNQSALLNVNFGVKEGALFGLIGPDGAGKTTLFRMITTLIIPNSGVVSVMGKSIVDDYRWLRQHIGYMPGRFSLYPDLTVQENLAFFATVFNTSLEENYEMVRPVYEQIEPFKHRRAGDLSGGMKQKLALSCALIHRPKVLVLDEPTTGVDAVSRKEFWYLLKQIQQQGVTIIVATPYMDEAALCDRMVLIRNGKVLTEGTLAEIESRFMDELWILRGRPRTTIIDRLREHPKMKWAYHFGEDIHFVVQPNTVTESEIRLWLQSSSKGNIDGTVDYLTRGKAEIEDVFIDLSGGHDD